MTNNEDFDLAGMRVRHTGSAQGYVDLDFSVGLHSWPLQVRRDQVVDFCGWLLAMVQVDAAAVVGGGEVLEEGQLAHFETHPERRSGQSVMELCAEIRRLKAELERCEAELERHRRHWQVCFEMAEDAYLAGPEG